MTIGVRERGIDDVGRGDSTMAKPIGYDNMGVAANESFLKLLVLVRARV